MWKRKPSKKWKGKKGSWKREREREREKWTTIKMRSTGPHSIWFFNLNITVSLLRLLKPSGNNRATPADWLPHHQPNPINIQMKPNDVESGYSNGPHWVRFGNLVQDTFWFPSPRIPGSDPDETDQLGSAARIGLKSWSESKHMKYEHRATSNARELLSNNFLEILPPSSRGHSGRNRKACRGNFWKFPKRISKKKNATKKDHPRTAEIQTEVLRISKEQSGIAN